MNFVHVRMNTTILVLEIKGVGSVGSASFALAFVTCCFRDADSGEFPHVTQGNALGPEWLYAAKEPHQPMRLCW